MIAIATIGIGTIGSTATHIHAQQSCPSGEMPGTGPAMGHCVPCLLSCHSLGVPGLGNHNPNPGLGAVLGNLRNHISSLGAVLGNHGPGLGVSTHH
jgi:hypothetical protein